MTQCELDHAVARVTGESVEHISETGFVPLTHGPVEIEPWAADSYEKHLDWDEIDARRDVVFPMARAFEPALV